jgi:hypothetical protein
MLGMRSPVLGRRPQRMSMPSNPATVGPMGAPGVTW